MKIVILILLIFCTSSCQSPYHAAEKKAINEVYIASGAEQYFLPEMPNWANVSEVAECRLMDRIRFLDFSTLNKRYNLNFKKLIQFNK